MLRRLSAALCCALSLLPVPVRASDGTLGVDERATRAELGDGSLRVALAVSNGSSTPSPVRVRVELVDPDDHVTASAERGASAPPGSHAIEVAVGDRSKASGWDVDQITSTRVRYRVVQESGGRSVEGLIALSEITPDVFELHVALPRTGGRGKRYRATVFATRPVTHRPVADVPISATLSLDTGPVDKLTDTARTDGKGVAVVAFDLPKGASVDGAELEVTGRLGGFGCSTRDDVEISGQQSRIVVSTDKGLYQPGQTLHMRGLAFDSSKRAVAGTSMTFVVDCDGETVFRDEATTSRFGVASLDWKIPESAVLGTYEIHVEVDDDAYGPGGFGFFAVSRYELPIFAVASKLDRPYYLPGQSASVEIGADYLFGKPVTRGHVRVVQEADGHWDYRQQKWVADEVKVYEGEVRQDGRFDVDLDLSEEHAKLADNDYERFRDATFVAYVTDASTGRTEQRRFDVRVTKEPIHVYVLAPDRGVAGHSVDLFVAAAYADGTAAQCEVRVLGALAGRRIAADDSPRQIARVRTTRFGVAKVRVAPLTPDGDDVSTSSLYFEARDGSGRVGHHTEALSLGEGPAVRVTPDKTIYAPGEPIRARVESSERDTTVAVDLVLDDEVVDSRVVRLDDGSGSAIFPFREAYRGALTIAAYAPTTDHDRYSWRRADVSVRRVLYPRETELTVSLRGAHDAYRPGAPVHAELRLRDAEGRPVEGVLGVAAIDRAVEERARSERWLGSGEGLFAGYDMMLDGGAGVGGLTRRDLDRLDLSRPVPADVALTAELVMLDGLYFDPTVASSDEDVEPFATIFKTFLDKQTTKIHRALTASPNDTRQLPTTDNELRAALAAGGLPDAAPVDPWGTPLAYEYSVERDQSVLSLQSAGPDKRLGTDDDFLVDQVTRPYFVETGEAVNRAVVAYFDRTDRPVRDSATLRTALDAAGIPAPALRDRWGQPYATEFGVSGRSLTIRFVSNGPDRRASTPDAPSPDDFAVWTTRVDYFAHDRARIGEALADPATAAAFPRDARAFTTALSQSGVDFASLRDPWGRPYFPKFAVETTGGRAVVRDQSTYGDANSRRASIIMVDTTAKTVYVASPGPDGVRDTPDDVDVAAFAVSADNVPSATPVTPVDVWPVGTGTTGAITGTIADVQGFIIPAAVVTATNVSSGFVYKATSDSDGRYTISEVPPGMYDVRVDATSFKTTVISLVPVRSSVALKLDVQLEVGAVSETVTVTASESGLHVATSASATEVVTKANGAVVKWSGRVDAQMSTPRLREYFPETLLWQPSLETDSRGRATIDFSLADSITTWRLAVFASTADGRVGRVTTDLVAFQPFFVEHDPPKVLTEGDRVDLPVVLRNYLDTPQSVDVEMKPESWFTIDGPSRRRVETAPGDSARAVFGVRAIAEVDGGKQRVTATGPKAGDAVEKPVSVHPDGEERAVTASRVVSTTPESSDLTFDLPIPDDALGTLRTEVKLYPNLFSHVVESVEAILERPYGCGEQTVSSTYPSVLLLERAAGKMPNGLETTAHRYARAGVDRLLGYQSPDGGFSYWGRGDSDVALTAYALRFMRDAQGLGLVDQQAVDRARDFLVKAQNRDGSWESQNLLVTAYIADSLALATGDDAAKTVAAKAVRQALDYLGPFVDNSRNPYLLACYALTAFDVGSPERAARAIARLEALAGEATSDGMLPFEGQTPFHGWGSAGALEATALAVRALERAARSGDARAGEIANRGISSLLRRKDRYGVWYSTQATINVLDVLMESVARREETAAKGPVEVFVNGARAATIDVPANDAYSGPVLADVTSAVARGANRIELRRGGRTAQGEAQVVATYYAPWPDQPRDGRADRTANGLRLAVAYDRTEANAGDTITCTVEAARAGAPGYGMLLGEIGLPPGAEVDRESLERAVSESGELDRYDVLPDRVVVYLWPWNRAARFSFTFRPRYGLSARAAPSSLYDYYNPDARVALAPPKFEVRGRD